MNQANRAKGLILLAAVFVAVSVISVGAYASKADTANTTLTVQAVAGKDLAQKTEACTAGSLSTDSEQCKQAAQKAAEVKAAPEPVTTVVVAPRRTDAEVMNLLEQVIQRNPGLLPKAQNGKDYVLTEADKSEIVAAVQGRIPTPANGTPGKDAVVDYDKIVAAVLALIPVPKNGVDGTTPPCMNTPAQCQGAEGAPGGPGTSVTDQAFVWTSDTQCVSRVQYSDGTVRQDPAGQSACDPATRPTPELPTP
jgi:hypothetical protein